MRRHIADDHVVPSRKVDRQGRARTDRQFLGISVHTVRRHLANTAAKLGVAGARD